MKKNGIVLVVSLVITAFFLFLSIPNFIEKEKIDELITRMEVWPGFKDDE